MLGDRFHAAVQYALIVHAGQTRKGTSVPYVSHLFAVTAGCTDTFQSPKSDWPRRKQAYLTSVTGRSSL